ncbi:acyltransferase [Yersinia bercovieri]|uniref:O-acetyltransferase WecH n=2 Tax=Yersinia bercovieri TaxID=634 RepID=A0A2G4U330_YERBE|nr:acyltransferase [Yersinia bercovieri]EEQ07132.1 Inner membrane protein yiaH [Yersinia bercovieri ATCC 43970]MCB5302847.1 acyltransferase [Yersinia bercovieri]PHZ27718.1 O-acetyltransferase [Yersinia bercovieri]QKJ06456.1 acyltransferase [Yersinia bercovieri ATCC 43970]CFQ35516.1 inner membrane protein YiaH [Yersinia bercovieri]
MTNKIGWIDNLRAVACIMVVMIHATTYYVTSGAQVGEVNWDIANLLNSASRACVPLFFMISGYLFFGEKSAKQKHFTRIGLCLLFYSIIALIYISTLTPIDGWASLKHILQKPVFYHLWFFYAIIVVYLVSPLINVKPVSGRYLGGIILLLAVLANPQSSKFSLGGFQLLPINLYIYGDTFYYLLYALLGRAIGMLETQGRIISWSAAALFILSVIFIVISTEKQTRINGSFADTFYMYCGPLVFVAAVSMLVWFKNCLNQQIGWLSWLAGHSLAIYGFHALIIHFIRTHHYDFTAYPVLDIFYVFALSLALSTLLSMGLQRIDRRRLVS